MNELSFFVTTSCLHVDRETGLLKAQMTMKKDNINMRICLQGMILDSMKDVIMLSITVILIQEQ